MSRCTRSAESARSFVRGASASAPARGMRLRVPGAAHRPGIFDTTPESRWPLITRMPSAEDRTRKPSVPAAVASSRVPPAPQGQGALIVPEVLLVRRAPLHSGVGLLQAPPQLTTRTLTAIDHAMFTVGYHGNGVLERDASSTPYLAKQAHWICTGCLLEPRWKMWPMKRLGLVLLFVIVRVRSWYREHVLFRPTRTVVNKTITRERESVEENDWL